MFRLDYYNIYGGKSVEIRRKINRGNREGIEIIDYKPLEKEIMEVSRESR